MSRKEARQESPYVRLARRAYGPAQQTVPPWSHPKSPHHDTFPQWRRFLAATGLDDDR